MLTISRRRWSLRVAPIVFFAALGLACASAEARATAVDSPTGDEEPGLAIDAAVRDIERIANEIANGRKYFERDLRPITIKASFSPENGLLYFDFDATLGPEAGYTEMADMTTDIEMATEDLSEHLPGFSRISYRFDGHDTGWWLDQLQGS